MNLSERIQPFYKHIGVIAVFLLLTFISFKPLFFGQKVIQHDIKMWKGGAQEGLDYRETHEEEPLWSNSMFSGMPAYLIATKYPGNLTKKIQAIVSLGLPGIASIMFFGLVSFYILLLTFKVKWQWALFGSISYAFSTFNIISIGAGHNSKVMAIALLPLMIAGLKLILSKKRLIGAALLSLGVALEIGAGHIQIAYYGFFIALALSLKEGLVYLKERDYKGLVIATAIVLACATLGLLPHTSRLLSLKEYGKYSTRGKSELNLEDQDAKNGLTRDYVFAWSQGKAENFTFLVPGMFGGASTGGVGSNENTSEFFKQRGIRPKQIKDQLRGIPFYHGDQSFVAGPIYIGAIAVFLFVVGLFVFKPKDYGWLLGLTILSIILSMGKNFPSINYLFYDYLPGYNKFRSVSMAVIIAQFSISFLAALTINKLFTDNVEISKKVKIAAASVIGLLTFLMVFAPMINVTGPNDVHLSQYPDLLEAILKDRTAFIRKDSFRSLFFIGLIAALFFLYRKKMVSSMVLGLLASAIIFADLAMVNHRYFTKDNFEKEKKELFEPTAADKFILDQPGDFRVFNLFRSPFNESETSYFHHSIGGYHGAKIRRYQDLIDYHISKNNIKVLQMLNTRYVMESPNERPKEIPTPGNAWFVETIIPVQSPQEEIEYLANPNFEPEKNAVVDYSYNTLPSSNYKKQGTITLTKNDLNTISYESNSAETGVGIFSEVFYPEGWTATIDGKETKILRANYILRALEIPAGKHEIVFTFRPPNYFNGEKLALTGSILLILLLLGSLTLSIKNYLSKNVN